MISNSLAPSLAIGGRPQCGRRMAKSGALTCRAPGQSFLLGAPLLASSPARRTPVAVSKCAHRARQQSAVASYQTAAAKKGSGHTTSLEYDFAVIGSGIAGLTYAIKTAKYGRVAIITKHDADEGCTKLAQGGVCAVLDEHDSVEKHIKDTQVAGAFLNDESAVEAVCSEGAERVLELIEFGAEFTRNKDGSLHLTREGGHSDRRIVHAADLTGAEIERALLECAMKDPNIDFFEHHMAVDLVTGKIGGVKACLGVDVIDQRDMALTRFVAPVTLLASGGGGQVYPASTNPAVSTGDGIAMAHRARAVIGNMEFVQFHPTGLYDPEGGSRRFLISEAVRGEGGILYNLGGERFMSKYDDRLELAPRDVVARAIDNEMKIRGDTHVLLDISHMPSDMLMGHFPNIAEKCLSKGIDICKDPIPVVPTQHYMCGGVDVGLQGETSLEGLFAAGEVSCTGLHGANRLASNSLLEGLVYGHRAAKAGAVHLDSMKVKGAEALAKAAREAHALAVKKPRPLSSATKAWVDRKCTDMRRVLWQSAGIVRTTKGLTTALEELAQLYVEANELLISHPLNCDILELTNLVTVAELIVSSALMRTESRGLHYVLDHPETLDSHREPTLINSTLKKRFDLAPLQTKLASSGGITADVKKPASPTKTANNIVVHKKRSAAKPREISLRATSENSSEK